MKIEGIHLKEVDDSFSLLSPSRSIEIKTDKGIITTPTRGATYYEFNRKKLLPTEISIDNPFTVYSKKFTGGDVSRLLTTNTEFANQVKSIERADHLSEYSTLHLCSFSIASISTNGPAPMEILSKDDNLNEFLSGIIDMQVETKHDIVSIPHLHLPLDSLKKTLKITNTAIQKLGKQPFFSLDLRYERFPDLLEYVTTDLQANMINLIYRKYRDVRNNYRELRKYVRKDIAFVTSEIERADIDHSNLATMHYMPFLGNDLYAVEIPPPNIPKPGKLQKPKNLSNLKVLNKDELTLVSLNESGMSNSKIIEEVGNTEDKLEEKLQNLTEAKSDSVKYDIINALTRVHELVVSSQEFDKLQDHVKQRDAKDYVKSKTKFEERINDFHKDL
ncbi:MAG TPA: hypothetical protein VNL34_04905 [Candidatus Nitrosotenuis sp.]|nr:hypothetical protein [Candidatus Nitrosotenuis sp.]